MDYDDSAGARRDGLLQRMKIDLPAIVIDQRIADQRDVLDFSEKIEEWVARLRDEQFVAGIAEHAE